jgi:hypothetical protein
MTTRLTILTYISMLYRYSKLYIVVFYPLSSPASLSHSNTRMVSQRSIPFSSYGIIKITQKMFCTKQICSTIVFRVSTQNILLFVWGKRILQSTLENLSDILLSVVNRQLVDHLDSGSAVSITEEDRCLIACIISCLLILRFYLLIFLLFLMFVLVFSPL